MIFALSNLRSQSTHWVHDGVSFQLTRFLGCKYRTKETLLYHAVRALEFLGSVGLYSRFGLYPEKHCTTDGCRFCYRATSDLVPPIKR